MHIPISLQSLEAIGIVIFEIILLLCNVITLKALDDAFAFVCANIICNRGLSIAAFGFWKSPSVTKYNYASNISLNSTIRIPLSRLSMFWIILEVLKLISPFPATGLRFESHKQPFGTSPCIVFQTEGKFIDRKWPYWQTKVSYAELVFGNGIGVLRSQIPSKMDYTTAIIFPQIVGAVKDGDSIVGDGFTLDIKSECSCVLLKENDLERVGVPKKFHASLINGSTNITYGTAMVSEIEANFTIINIY